MDGDGDLDVLLASVNDHSLRWFEQIPNPPGLLLSDDFEKGDTSVWSAAVP